MNGNWIDHYQVKARGRTHKVCARKKRAVPIWADLCRIKVVYDACAKISEATGIPHQVDHVVPLQSDKVCGLHVYENLAIIPAKLNQAKSNKVWPGMFK